MITRLFGTATKPISGCGLALVLLLGACSSADTATESTSLGQDEASEVSGASADSEPTSTTAPTSTTEAGPADPCIDRGPDPDFVPISEVMRFDDPDSLDLHYSSAEIEAILTSVASTGRHVEIEIDDEIDQAILAANDCGIAVVLIDADPGAGELAQRLMWGLEDAESRLGLVLVVAPDKLAMKQIDRSVDDINRAFQKSIAAFSRDELALGITRFTRFADPTYQP